MRKRKFKYIGALYEGDDLAILSDGRVLVVNPTRRPRVINPNGTIDILDPQDVEEDNDA